MTKVDYYLRIKSNDIKDMKGILFILIRNHFRKFRKFIFNRLL